MGHSFLCCPWPKAGLESHLEVLEPCRVQPGCQREQEQGLGSAHASRVPQHAGQPRATTPAGAGKAAGDRRGFHSKDGPFYFGNPGLWHVLCARHNLQGRPEQRESRTSH